MVDADEAHKVGRFQTLYRRLTLAFVLVAVAVTLLVTVVLAGIFVLGLGGRWAVLTASEWISVAAVVLTSFLVLELVLFFYYREKTRPKGARTARIKGRLVYSFTVPPEAKGGIFSKTFVPIDARTVVQVRYQMIGPTSLWKK